MNEETALLQLTGDASVQQRFLEMSHLYDAAIREIRTRLEILDRGVSAFAMTSNPIHHIDSRLKSPQEHGWPSCCSASGLPLTVAAAAELPCRTSPACASCAITSTTSTSLADLLTGQQDIRAVAPPVDYIRPAQAQRLPQPAPDAAGAGVSVRATRS